MATITGLIVTGIIMIGLIITGLIIDVTDCYRCDIHLGKEVDPPFPLR